MDILLYIREYIPSYGYPLCDIRKLSIYVFFSGGGGECVRCDVVYITLGGVDLMSNECCLLR
jgi:hypothetical protein